MIKPENHEREEERLELLQSYAILDTLPEEDYDNLTKLAAEICHTPVSMVTLVDDHRQWFKSNHGLNSSETPKEYAFCAHAIKDDNGIFMVEDARKDTRFIDNPLVDGEPHVIFYAGVPLKGPDGLPLGTLCVIDHEPNVLNANQIEALNILSKQVMNLLELRKKKLQLEKTNSVLKRNNQELERFADVAAHDLKAPLTNIISLAQSFHMIYKDKLDEEGRKIIGHIENSADTLKNLTDGILDYSKSVSVKPESSRIVLKTFGQNIARLFSATDNCSITIKSDLEYIVANKIALEQVLINLVTNAIKYNDKKRIEIELSVEDIGKFYSISVTDNGIGIPEKDQARIFELLQILSNKDRFGKRGSGIGLATVKRTVASLGGEIKVQSELGKGSKFTFTLKKQ